MKYLTIEEEMELSHKRYLFTNKIMGFLAERGFTYYEAERPTCDITTSILESVKHKWSQNLNLNVFYNDKVYEDMKNPLPGIRKLGVESIGEGKISTDIETISMANEILQEIGREYVIEISDSNLLTTLFKSLNIPKQEQIEARKLLKVKNHSMLDEFCKNMGDSPEEKLFKDLLTQKMSMKEIYELVLQCSDNSPFKRGIENLINISERRKNMGMEAAVDIDMSMTQEFDYYDGLILRGYVKGCNQAILKGGRYKAVSENMDKKIPAIGFSILVDEAVKLI